ncbi:MAG: ABC transporter permease [Bacteroidales bacterium]|nr:ABC transporter permease [Bacteroidales bacterium]
MKNYLMAWRNLWRNRRRTVITSASVLFAVVFALFFRSLQLGSYDYMFKSAIESYTGYIQIQHHDFWEERIVDNTFTIKPELNNRILQDENILATIPRFESFALASSGPQTKGVMVIGIDPEKENYLSEVENKLVRYRLTPEAVSRIKSDRTIPEKVGNLLDLYQGNSYTNSGRMQLDLGISDKDAGSLMPVIEKEARFENGHISMGMPGAWIGDKLSRYLEIGIGDTLVLIGQGYHATSAAGKYEIKGIVKQPAPDIDNKIVYLPLDVCQDLFNAPGNLTSLVLHVGDNSDRAVEETLNRMEPLISEPCRLIEWKEMNEVLVSQLDADNKSGMIMIGILYLVIAFGVFGTVLMMTAERRREFGVLVAIGMQKKKLASVVSLEMLYIGFLGILGGSFLAIPIILYGQTHPIVFKGTFAKMWEDFGFEPIMAFQGIDYYFLWQIFIVAIMVLIALMAPVRRILGMNVVNALKA